MIWTQWEHGNFTYKIRRMHVCLTFCNAARLTDKLQSHMYTASSTIYITTGSQWLYSGTTFQESDMACSAQWSFNMYGCDVFKGFSPLCPLPSLYHNPLCLVWHLNWVSVGAYGGRKEDKNEAREQLSSGNFFLEASSCFRNDISQNVCVQSHLSVCDLRKVNVCERHAYSTQCNDRLPNEKLGSDWLADKAAHCIIMSWIIDAHGCTRLANSVSPSGQRRSWSLA